MVASDSLHAIAELEVVREGYVVRRARLPEKRWHTLRHTFGTHTALFGVNPWRLQSWMGHKRIDETMIYVHVAENHRLGTRGKNLGKTQVAGSEKAVGVAS